MSVGVMHLVWQKAPFQGNTLLTLLALADWSNDEGESWPVVEKLAKKSRQSERNCHIVIAALKAAGFLFVTPRKRRSNLFQINLSKLDGCKNFTHENLMGEKYSKMGEKHDKMGEIYDKDGCIQLHPDTSVDTSVDTSIKTIHQGDDVLFTLQSEKNEITKLPETKAAHLSEIAYYPNPNVLLDELFDLQSEKSKESEITRLPEWKEFIEMRRACGHPLVTAGAKSRMIARLRRLNKETGHEIPKMLQQSCDRTWTDVYELKNQDKKNPEIAAEPDALEEMRRKEKARYGSN